MNDREHKGIPPTCGCKDYGVHRDLRRIDYERTAGRESARELGGKHLEDYNRRVADAEHALALERKAAGMPGRVNPTPGQLIKQARIEIDKFLAGTEFDHRYSLFGRIGAAFRGFFNP